MAAKQEYARIFYQIEILISSLLIRQRNWEYEPLSLTSYSSDENLLKITTKVDRLGRSEYAFSMTLDWNYDVDKDTMDAFIKNVGHCSNMVQFEGDFVPPWPRNVYKLDKCVASGEGLPDIAPEGFFKLEYKMTGQVDWGFTLIVKVSPKVI
ncbi:GD11360 [Drosophila simulans]|uniref:GD11360 n=1 Tax=Drosophila simulans TaxID=7240 RepID=B4QCC7_DROSI|nr:GD11360 [Drosophila simulans]